MAPLEPLRLSKLSFPPCASRACTQFHILATRTPPSTSLSNVSQPPLSHGRRSRGGLFMAVFAAVHLESMLLDLALCLCLCLSGSCHAV